MTKTLINRINWYKSYLIWLLATYYSKIFISVCICTSMSANCSFRFVRQRLLLWKGTSLHLKVLLMSKQVCFIILQLLNMVLQSCHSEHSTCSEPQHKLVFVHLKQSWYCRRGKWWELPSWVCKQWHKGDIILSLVRRRCHKYT